MRVELSHVVLRADGANPLRKPNAKRKSSVVHVLPDADACMHACRTEPEVRVGVSPAGREPSAAGGEECSTLSNFKGQRKKAIFPLLCILHSRKICRSHRTRGKEKDRVASSSEDGTCSWTQAVATCFCAHVCIYARAVLSRMERQMRKRRATSATHLRLCSRGLLLPEAEEGLRVLDDALALFVEGLPLLPEGRPGGEVQGECRRR